MPHARVSSFFTPVIAALSTTFCSSAGVATYIAFYRLLAILDYYNWVLKVCGTSSDCNLVGDHPWLGRTTYGTVDSPAGLSMAAIDSPARPSTATKFAVDGSAGPAVGG